MIEACAESYSLKAVVLRPFSVYGPNPAPESLFGTIMKMAHSGAIRLRDLRPVRDYCYVKDLANAVLRATCLNAGGVETFNIGTGRGTSVADFAALVVQSIGIDLAIVEGNSGSRPECAETFELIADISKARNILRWKPEIDLEEGVRRALAASEQ
jgi:nucleoside-diphosphate-sugar epimerase